MPSQKWMTFVLVLAMMSFAGFLLQVGYHAIHIFH